MAWIELHQSLPHHQKTYRMAAELVISRATVTGIVACIWVWCLDCCGDGDLSNVPDDVLSDISCSGIDGAKLRKAMKTAGFLDSDGKIHDWADYAGHYNSYRAANRERQRRLRERRKERNVTRNVTHNVTGHVMQNVTVTHDLPTNQPDQPTGTTNRERRARATFVAPSHEQVTEYAITIQVAALECERFIDYYTANGWRVGRNAMKDWKAALRNWKRRSTEMRNGRDGGHKGQQRFYPIGKAKRENQCVVCGEIPQIFTTASHRGRICDGCRRKFGWEKVSDLDWIKSRQVSDGA